MSKIARILGGAGGGLAALAGAGWLGTLVPPLGFPPYAPGRDLGTVELPAGLPAPVRRYFLRTVGERMPRVATAVLWGTARMNMGLWVRARFRVFHHTGYDFVRDMHVTWFGLPVLRARDQYLNGAGATILPWGSVTGPQMDQGANLIIWAEGVVQPSLLAADPRIRWLPVDDATARLIVPLGDQEDELSVRFDPQTALVTQMWTMRYRGLTGPKEPWRVDFSNWQRFPSGLFPSEIAITWEQQGRPWSYWHFEGLAWNVDIREVIPGAVQPGWPQ